MFKKILLPAKPTSSSRQRFCFALEAYFQSNLRFSVKASPEANNPYWPHQPHFKKSLTNNRPFYRDGGHIELIRLKKYYGMAQGHEHDPKYSLSNYARFSGQFFVMVLQNKIVMGKKIVVPCLAVIMIAFSREIYSERPYQYMSTECPQY